MPVPETGRDPTITEPAGDGFARKRQFLESGTAWPDQPPPEVIDTHASLVLLTRDRVWKLKKPVLLSHIDLRDLQARAHFCREELRLNRQLAGEVYRGLTPLVERPDRGLALGGPGRVVDWLIEMERLPQAAMLDIRLRDGPTPRADEIEAVIGVMTAFYHAREVYPDAGALCLDRLLDEARINAAHLREMRAHLDVPLREDVLDHGISGLEAQRPEIVARGEDGIVVEGHGDLRAEHVCLTAPPVIFDRVEFNHGMRLIDPYYEFNALGMECALAGAEWIRPLLLRGLERSGMPPPSPALLAVYNVARYLTRARLAIDHLRDSEIRTPQKWPAQARLYLQTAAEVHDEAGL